MANKLKLKKVSKIWVFVGIVAVVAIAFFFLKGGKKKETISFDTAKVEKANIQNGVTATGTVEPVTEVTVGTQVSGIVNKIYVDYNSEVKKGQVIAELDRSTLESALKSAQASLERSKAEAESAVATLQSAQATLNYQQANYNRYNTLYQKGLVSANDYESAYLSYRQAAEQVASSKQSVLAADQSVASAQESVNTAKTNLSYATITSPIDGIVLSKDIEEGQTVAASFETPELFTIAQDLTNMQVVADVDEADIGNVKPGERVSFTVDAYPDDTFEGTVKQVRQEATTTNNVVTYEVVISAPNGDLKLKPGLTANVTIYTAEKTGVVSVPSKALRFNPTSDVLGKAYKIIDNANAKNKVWVLQGNQLKAVSVTIGETDGIHTQIISGISEGTTIITAVTATKEEEEPENATEESPFGPKAPGKDKDKKKS